MLSICPKCQYQRLPEDGRPDNTCPNCGIVYHKFKKAHPSKWRVKRTPAKNLSPKELRKEKIKNIAILLFVFSGGLLFFISSYFDIREGNASLTWPRTEGLIIQSYVSKEKNDSNSSAGSQVIGSKKYTYSPVVQYQYAVNGQRYTGYRIGIVGRAKAGTEGKAWANSVNRQFPVGRTVSVYFNPDNHAKAVLEPGKQPASALLLVIGVFVMIVSLAGMIFIAKTRKSMQEILTSKR